MPKICLVNADTYPVPAVLGGAVETLITHIIKEQEKAEKLDITIVSAFNKVACKNSKKYKNTNFIYIKKGIVYRLKSALFGMINKLLNKNLNTYAHTVLKKIKNENYDYVIIESGYYDTYSIFLKYFKKEQLVLHLHNQLKPNEIINKTYGKLIGVSNFIIDDYKKNSKISDTYLLKNCVSINNFTKKTTNIEKQNICKKYNFQKEDFIVVYCGRLIKEKGVLELIKAVNDIDKPNIKLLIIGSINFGNGGNDEYTTILHEIAKKNKRIHFTGFVNNNELYKYYSIANCMVIPSICEEAAGLVCIEGMISKLPIITTGSGGIKEYVTDNSLIVNRKNLEKDIKTKILKVYENNSIFIEKAKQDYEVAKSYSSKNYYDNFTKIVSGWNNEKEKSANIII